MSLTSPRTDLETDIRETYELQQRYQAALQQAATPQEQRRAWSASADQQGFLRDDLEQYRSLELPAADLPADIAAIAAQMEIALTTPEPAEGAQSGARRKRACPFEYSQPVSPDRFYGRHKQMTDIKNRIGGTTAQSISIIGLDYSGKSSLLRYIHERPQKFFQPAQQPLTVLLDLQDRHLRTPQGMTEALRQAIAHEIGTPPWPPEANEDTHAVDAGLAAVRDTYGRRLVVLIDDFERIGARLEQFQAWGVAWRERALHGSCALVIASKRPLAEIYDTYQSTMPFDGLFEHTTPGTFETYEWHLLVRSGFARGGIHLSDADMALIDELAGALPCYTQLAAAMLWQHRDAEKTRAAFTAQVWPRFRTLWHSLSEAEQHALNTAVMEMEGSSGANGLTTPHAQVQVALQEHGVLRPDGHLFSSVFTAFVQHMQPEEG
jgi:hypothetical protein